MHLTSLAPPILTHRSKQRIVEYFQVLKLSVPSHPPLNRSIFAGLQARGTHLNQHTRYLAATRYLHQRQKESRNDITLKSMVGKGDVTSR